jgi:hypothetical protein
MSFSWSGPQLMAQGTSDCNNFEISTQITNTSNGSNNGQVTISSRGGVLPYYYVFYYENGHLVTKENTKNSLSGLPAGIIYCSIVDAKGCTKKVKIDIK